MLGISNRILIGESFVSLLSMLNRKGIMSFKMNNVESVTPYYAAECASNLGENNC